MALGKGKIGGLIIWGIGEEVWEGVDGGGGGERFNKG